MITTPLNQALNLPNGMRQKLIILTILLVPMILLAGGNERNPTVASVQLVTKQGLWYEVNSETPFSGFVTRTFLSGRKESERSFVNGRHHGYVRRWYENGNIRREANYVNGQSDGLETRWYPNGQIKSVLNKVNGRADGDQTALH